MLANNLTQAKKEILEINDACKFLNTRLGTSITEDNFFSSLKDTALLSNLIFSSPKLCGELR